MSALRIGTRNSPLALTQAELACAQLDQPCELIPFAATGEAVDKSRWVTELERALLEGAIDLAVHSAKDVPGEIPDGLTIWAAQGRAQARDALCGASSLEELRPGARVGTSSLRRRSQLLSLRSDLEITELHGNVDTRVKKLHAGEFDAIVLAAAGLERLGLTEEIGCLLPLEPFVPAPGQGVLVFEGQERRGEPTLADSVLRAERTVAARLGADCNSPLGVHAEVQDEGGLVLHAYVGLPDGSHAIYDRVGGDCREAEQLACNVVERLLAVGATELIKAAQGII